MNLAIIQARTSSTRLPKKILMNLADKTVLEHVIERVSQSEFVDEVLVATTINKNDLSLVSFCSSIGIRVFVGSEHDVLDRYYQAAKLFDAKNIIRITSDCPLIDPEIIDLIGQHHLLEKAEYTSNTLEETYPDGLDVEVFTFNALTTAWKESKLTSEREHVTPFIKNHPEKFKLFSVRSDTNLSNFRWTIDQSEDYDFLNEIFKRIYSEKPNFRMNDVLKEINKDSKLLNINKGIVRNEGYLKSLAND